MYENYNKLQHSGWLFSCASSAERCSLLKLNTSEEFASCAASISHQGKEHTDQQQGFGVASLIAFYAVH